MSNKNILARLFALFLFITLAFCTEGAKEYTPVTKFDPERDPYTDLAAASEAASSTGKRIILDVGGEWCIWCHRLDDFIESNIEIKNKLEEYFIILKINFSPENKNEKFLAQYPEIAGYPHFFVLESDGKLLHSQNTGLLEENSSYSKEKIIEFLTRWAPDKQ